MSIFMHLEGIDNGEAADANHPGWIDVVDLIWGTSRSITSRAGTRDDRESGNAEMSELILNKFMDRTSPALFRLACCGRGRTVTLALTKTGHGRGTDVFNTYTLDHALVSGYQVDANAEDVTRPLEAITLSFRALEQRYVPYDDGGSALSPIVVGIDAATNKRK